MLNITIDKNFFKVDFNIFLLNALHTIIKFSSNLAILKIFIILVNEF